MKKGIKHTSPLPVIAAAVVIVAAGVTFMPKKTGSQTSPSPASTVSAGTGGAWRLSIYLLDGDAAKYNYRIRRIAARKDTDQI